MTQLQEPRTWDEEQDFGLLGLWGDKKLRGSFLGLPPQGQQHELFLCSFTVNNLLYGTKMSQTLLWEVWGRAGEESCSDCVWGECRESSGDLWVTGELCEGA